MRAWTPRLATCSALAVLAVAGRSSAQAPVGAAPAQGQTQEVAASAAAGPRAISLDEALALARRNAPGVIQTAGQLRAGRARVRTAYAAFLPGLSVSLGTTRQYAADRTRIENGQIVQLPSTPWSYNAGMGANLSVFEGGRRFFELRQARAGLTAAEANDVSEQYLVDLDVKQQFFNVLAARETEVAAYAQVEQAEQQLRAAVLRLRAARATKSDSLRSEILLRNARLARLQAQNEIETANAALARAVGASEPVTAAPLDTDEATPLAADETTLAGWLDRGPSVTQADAQLRSARASRATTWADYLPSVSASYSRGGSGSGTDAWFGPGELSYNGTFRLSLSLPIFNQLAREEQAVTRDVAVDNAEAALRDARLAARESLTRYWGALRTADQRVEAQTASVEAAEEDLRVQQQRYALGESTLLDVLTSQTQLNDARAALIRARYDRRIARAQLEALVGRDL